MGVATMRRGRHGRMLLMVSSMTAHITIDVSVDDQEIRGQISCGAGESRQFSGWLALISALDDLLTRPPADDGDGSGH